MTSWRHESGWWAPGVSTHPEHGEVYRDISGAVYPMTEERRKLVAMRAEVDQLAAKGEKLRQASWGSNYKLVELRKKLKRGYRLTAAEWLVAGSLRVIEAANANDDAEGERYYFDARQKLAEADKFEIAMRATPIGKA